MKTREVKRSPKEFQYGLCLLGGGNQPNKLSTKDFSSCDGHDMLLFQDHQS